MTSALLRNRVFRCVGLIVFVAVMPVTLINCRGYLSCIRIQAITSIPATLAFEEDQVPKNFRLYYAGRENQPNAILALAPEYTVSEKEWGIVDLSKESLGAILERISDPRASDSYIKPRGQYIFAPDGKQIGIIYSRFSRIRYWLCGNLLDVF